MSKLFSLKEWLTIADAARYLSVLFGEEVTEADVLRLGLDGRFRLSVYFVNRSRARCGKVITWDETNWLLLPKDDFIGDQQKQQIIPGITNKCRPKPPKLEELYAELCESDQEKYYPLMREMIIDDERFLALSDDVTILEGVWDLPMIGNERPDIESRYQFLTCGPSVASGGLLAGVFVEGIDGQICHLQAKHYPAIELPKDAVIVVRTEALRDFEQTLNSAPAAKPEGHLNHDLEMQQQANQIAEEHRANGKSVTRDYVAKLLAEKLGIKQETVVRRIRKQW